MHEVVEEMHFAFINAKASLVGHLSSQHAFILPRFGHHGILVSPQIYQTISESSWLPLHLSHFPVMLKGWHHHLWQISGWSFGGSGCMEAAPWWANYEPHWMILLLDSWNPGLRLIQDSTTANDKGKLFKWCTIFSLSILWILWMKIAMGIFARFCDMLKETEKILGAIDVPDRKLKFLLFESQKLWWIWGSAERFRILKCVAFGKDSLLMKVGSGISGVPILTSSQVYC